MGTGTGVIPRGMAQYGANIIATDISHNQINEAIELSKKYSDEKVSKMINGVLDKIYHEVEDKSE